MTAPLVSICIPTYQGRPFLREAIDCACAQDYENLEIILSDSGSTDGTVELAHELAAQSPFPFRIEQAPAPGMVANWNACLGHARGAWIKFLFQDDVIEPECVARLVEAATMARDVGLAFSPRRLLIDEASRDDPVVQFNSEQIRDLHGRWEALKPIQDGRALLRDRRLLTEPVNKIGEPSTVLLAKAALEDVGLFDDRLKQYVDVELWWRIMARWKVAFVPDTLSAFRLHAAQQTGVNTKEEVPDALMFFSILRDGPVMNALTRRQREEIEARARGERFLPRSERMMRALARLLGRR